jgi:hypothetical protein
VTETISQLIWPYAAIEAEAQLLGSEAFELSLVGERVLVGSYGTYVAYISYSRYALG